jgi:hypothetical protein
VNIYEVIYIRGYDHDDWDKLTVTAENEAEAERKGQDRVPPGCRLKKIKLLQRTGSHGTMYAFDVELSDGTQGSVNAKSPNKWNAGDDVEYTATSTHHGTKLKLDKPGFNGAPSPRNNDDSTKGIIASWAVGVAMQVADRDAPNYDVQVMQYARLALEARKQIKNEVQP